MIIRCFRFFEIFDAKTLAKRSKQSWNRGVMKRLVKLASFPFRCEKRKSNIIIIMMSNRIELPSREPSRIGRWCAGLSTFLPLDSICAEKHGNWNFFKHIDLRSPTNKSSPLFIKLVYEPTPALTLQSWLISNFLVYFLSKVFSSTGYYASSYTRNDCGGGVGCVWATLFALNRSPSVYSAGHHKEVQLEWCGNSSRICRNF